MNYFAGILSREPREDLSSQVEKMLSTMSLPSTNTDFFLSKNSSAVFGQTDEEFGVSSNQQYLIACQGKIYNLPELKQKLIDHGQVIQGDSQSDLTILAYQTWGPEFLQYLDGSFVLFIYDKREKKLLIGRDKIGSHRVYWGQFSGTFIFTSLLKGILTSKYVPQHPCLESIAAYFYLGYFPQDKTPIANLNCLLPGYYILVNSEISLVVHKYWSFKSADFGSGPSTPEDVSKHLDHLLLKATEKRNPNKEPMHCFMQGDIGSSSIAHYAKRVCPDSTFGHSLDFEGLNPSYLPYVDRVSQSLQIPLDKQLIGIDSLFNNLSQVVWNLDEPVADPNSVLVWNLAKSLKGKTNSVFSSLGAKEFLGVHLGHASLGYEPLFLWFLELSRPLILRAGIPLLSKIDKTSAFHALRFFQSDFWAVEYIKQSSLFKKNELKKIAPSIYKHFDFSIYIQQTYQYLKYVHSQNFDMTDYLFYDAETMLCNYLLVQHQNLLRSENISLCCPFLDQEVFSFLMHTPEYLKSRRKKQAIPLQQILSQSLTQEDLNYEYKRDARSMNLFTQSKEIHELVNVLATGTLAESGIISERGLREEFAKGSRGCIKFGNLWSILILEIWFKLFVNRPVYSYPEVGNLAEYLDKP